MEIFNRNLRLYFIHFLLLVATNTFAQISNKNSQELFKIHPYTLLHTNQQLLLNFQLNRDESLSIEDGQKIYKTQIFKKNQQYQIELAPSKCGEDKDIRISIPQLMNANSENKFTVVYIKKLSKIECPKTLTEKDIEEDFSFGFISDTQEFADRHGEVAKVLAHHHSLSPLKFIVNGGDVVQTGDDESEWFKYFTSGKAYLMDIPQIAAIGNHDYRGHYNIQMPPLFKKYMRWQNADVYGNLFYEFNNFTLIVFNSNFQLAVGTKERVMLEWIERKIVESKNKNKTVILATHFPAYSSSLNKYTTEAVIKIRQFLVPVLEKNKVPLLLSGHTHMFERSIKNNVHYLVAGPAGGRPNTASDENPYKVAFDEKALTFTKVTVSKKQITLTTYNEANMVIDQVEIPTTK